MFIYWEQESMGTVLSIVSSTRHMSSVNMIMIEDLMMLSKMKYQVTRHKLKSPDNKTKKKLKKLDGMTQIVGGVVRPHLYGTFSALTTLQFSVYT